MVSVYLAYKAGAFDDEPHAPEKGMDKGDFAQWAIGVIGQWDDAVILEVGKPVGMVKVLAIGSHLLVKAYWFPWATLRNKIETTLRFLLDYKDRYHILAPTDERDFMTHLFRYGVVRAIGVSKGFDTTLYESVGK